MVKNIKHIAIISDGNGRWAKARGLSRSEGHKAGEKTFVQLCQDVSELGISYLTIYCNLRSATATGAVVNGHSAERQRPA